MPPTPPPNRTNVASVGLARVHWLWAAAIKVFFYSPSVRGTRRHPGARQRRCHPAHVGLLLSFAAAPGWLELVLMYPNRVGGIASACTAAFRPYSEILSALTGVCYWWGWVPTCGLTAIFSAGAIQQWLLPDLPVPGIAITIVLICLVLNLTGIRPTTRVASVSPQPRQFWRFYRRSFRCSAAKPIGSKPRPFI